MSESYIYIYIFGSNCNLSEVMYEIMLEEKRHRVSLIGPYSVVSVIYF